MIVKLYEKYNTELVRWCQRITGNLQTAEELVQETWLRALNHNDSLTLLNIERTIDSAEDLEVKIINGAYEITSGMMPTKPVILDVNGFLKVWPGTEEILKKYECMIINGAAEFPESLKGSLDRMIVNGQVTTYPDDSVILEDDFIMDAYFPIRAREGMKYFARNAVIIRDADVDITKLIQKNVKFQTP